MQSALLSLKFYMLHDCLEFWIKKGKQRLQLSIVPRESECQGREDLIQITMPDKPNLAYLLVNRAI